MRNLFHYHRLIPPSLKETRFSSTGSYRNFACNLRGTSVLPILKFVRNPIIISLVSRRAKYFPIQLRLPAEKGMKEYG